MSHLAYEWIGRKQEAGLFTEPKADAIFLGKLLTALQSGDSIEVDDIRDWMDESIECFRPQLPAPE